MTIDTIKERLSEEIKNSRKSQKEIAKQLKIDQSMISMYVTKKNVPKIDTFADLCKLLDLDANYILGISDFAGEKKL